MRFIVVRMIDMKVFGAFESEYSAEQFAKDAGEYPHDYRVYKLRPLSKK